MSRIATILVALAVVLVGRFFPGHVQANDQQQLQFFEKRIRPVLIKHCYECHAANSQEVEGGLLLDTREGIRRGGDSGHAVVPSDVEASLLINALRFQDYQMPPDEQLPEQIIADFEKWVEMGAPDPRAGKSQLVKKEIDFDQAREFWAFQPPRKPSPPRTQDSDWARTEIDRFLLAKMESQGLHPVADAAPHDLVRRVYFDLIGLPPTPLQTKQFVADPSPEALKQLIDRLLETPQFGERWGRHWLDVVRYGESSGMERNFTFPYAWRYRDYVIKSFNEDKPYDQFVMEQVAGDLLPAESIERRNEQMIATGLLALGPKSLNETNAEKFMMDVVDEQIDVTTQAFMAITASCARCHDHKFDPIPTKEYYALAGIFSSTETLYGTGGNRGNRRAGRLLALGPDAVTAVGAAGSSGRDKKAVAALAKRLKIAQQRLKQLRNREAKGAAGRTQAAAEEARVQRMQAQLRRLRKNAPAETASAKDAVLAMAVQDVPQPADTQLRIRGEANQRGERVPRGFLTVASQAAAPSIEAAGSGRLAYAKWLATQDNPLTARVAVNRIWQHLFARGIVSSVNNFGVNGDTPTHPQLLDYLAVDFIENGWSIKQLIRHCMNSHVYQLSCDVSEPAQQLDPDNQLLWRMNQRRLEAEAIRDAVLATSGQLDLGPGSGSIVESMGDTDIGSRLRTGRVEAENSQRSVYLPIVRSAVPELLQVFDFPDPSIIFGQREVTTVPTQALYMMNSPFVIEQAGYFAQRVLSEGEPQDAARVDLAFRLALSRPPSPAELEQALAFLAPATNQKQAASGETTVAAWTGFCQSLLACSEFRYVN